MTPSPHNRAHAVRCGGAAKAVLAVRALRSFRNPLIGVRSLGRGQEAPHSCKSPFATLIHIKIYSRALTVISPTMLGWSLQ